MKKNLLLAFLVASLSGCGSVSYLSQAGLGQLALYNRQKPLSEAIADPQTPSEVRNRLEQIPQIKKYVEQKLQSKATSNYTNYVALKKPYVVWALTVAEKNKLKIFEWSFPFFGKFPYLGFFDQATAETWAADYRNQGYDTSIRGVPAYSTLGFLPDPLLSSMMHGELSDLANLVFHETCHSIIYVKGQASFNEQVASLVGDYGELLWITEQHGTNSSQYKMWFDQKLDRKKLGQLLRSFAEELKNFYSIKSSNENFEGLKQKLFISFQEKIKQESWKNARTKKWADRLLNNADLLAVLTYDDDQELYEHFFNQEKGSLVGFLDFLKKGIQEWEQLPEGEAVRLDLVSFFKTKM